MSDCPAADNEQYRRLKKKSGRIGTLRVDSLSSSMTVATGERDGKSTEATATRANAAKVVSARC